MSRAQVNWIFVTLAIPCAWLVSVVWLMAAVTFIETLPRLNSARDFVSLYMGLGSAIVTTLGFGGALLMFWTIRPKPTPSTALQDDQER